MDKWVELGASISAVGAVGWALVRFLDWRRRLSASLSRTTPEEA